MARCRHRYQAIARHSRPMQRHTPSWGASRARLSSGWPSWLRSRMLHRDMTFDELRLVNPGFSALQFPAARVPPLPRPPMGRQKTNYAGKGQLPASSDAEKSLRAAPGANERRRGSGRKPDTTRRSHDVVWYLWYLNEPQAPLRSPTLFLPSG